MGATDEIDRFLRALAAVGAEGQEELDRLDAAAGDGDFGTTLARGAVALAAEPPVGDGPADRLRAAANTLTGAMGGTSGPLAGVALIRAARAVGSAEAVDAETAGAMVRAAAEGIQEYGEAEPGDKTLIDALLPLAEALEGGRADEAANAAREGADGTTDQTARRGRAAYAGDRSRGEPDAGAVGVALIAERFANGDLPSWEDLAGRTEAPAEAGAGPGFGFVDRPEDLVDRALDGFAAAHSDLVRRLDGHQVIARRDGPAGDRVALVSGGGAGHEPLHAGFVGAGMLDAACPGAVFVSPAPDEVVAATEAAAGTGGVLYIVKNYTGDVLNFRLAAEQAADAGIATATVVVADDVALEADDGPGRRGTGVTVAVEKLAGAKAAEGAPLDEVHALAERVAERGRSFGVALHGEEMELGVGIHGEPGRPREDKAGAGTLAGQLLEPLLDELEPPDGASLLVVVSGLGGTPPLELHALYELIRRELDERGLEPARTLVGDVVTSLGQPGAVLSLVVLDEELERLWDAPVWTPALRWR